MQTKICNTCKEEKALTEFHKSKDSKDGVQYSCKTCAIDIAKLHYKENGSITKSTALASERRHSKCIKLVNKIKKQYGCSFCGEQEPCCLDFHHKNPKEKHDNVSLYVSRKNLIKIISEINKCIVVCSNCHRKIHAGLIDCSDSDLCYESLDEWKPFLYKKRAKSLSSYGKDHCKCGSVKRKTSNYCRKCASKFKYHRKKFHVTKEELARLVWEKPITKIAIDFNVSDNTVIKYCKLYDIERPPTGYWLRKPNL